MQRLIKLLFLFLLLFSLTGCQKKQEINHIKEIEFWTLQLSEFSGYINSVINKYEKENPYIKIKWIDIPFSLGEKRALAAVMSKNVPDLINMNPDFGAALASKGALTEISPMITSEEKNSYLKIIWDCSSIDGFIYGIPWYVTSAVTFYNKSILEDAEIKKIPRTYSEIQKISVKIKNKTGKYSMMPPLAENGKMLRLFNKYGIPIIKKENKSAVFNTDKAEKVLQLWKNMYRNKLIPAESITQGHRKALEKFQSGETAFIEAGANFLNIIRQNAPEIYKKLGVFSQITGDANQPDFSLMNLVIPKKSKYPKEALKFALFLTNSENQLEFCKLAPVLPSQKNTLNSGYFSEVKPDDLEDKSRFISSQQIKNPLKPIPVLKNRKELYEIIDYMTQEVLLDKKEAREGLNEAVLKWNRVIRSNFYFFNAET